MPARRRILLVTNDFPPTLGGIQTYLNDFVHTLDPSDLVVFASTQDAEAAAEWDRNVDFEVIRWPRSVMLPTPATARRMQEIISEYGVEVVWFGACAPLALMGKAAKKAGATRVVASTHGHEIGWSMIPVARQLLGLMGRRVDTITYVSEYAHRRTEKAFRSSGLNFTPLQPGVDLERFTPDDAARTRIRSAWGVDSARVIVCVSRIVPRKGQDTLVECMPLIVKEIPDAHLMIVGPGDKADALRKRASKLGVSESVTVTGPVDFDDLPAYFCAGDVFAMPVRTLGGGLDVEGLGIVFLEAQACGVPVVAGDGGGAPETVKENETGLVVDGRNHEQVAASIVKILSDPNYARQLGAAGREYMENAWSWSVRGPKLAEVLYGAID